MSVGMGMHQSGNPEPPRKPEFTPKFPYEHLPYTHIHPSEPGDRAHVLFRAHDCWCEPLPVFVWGLNQRPVAILLVHSDEKAPKYPKYAATNNEP